MTDPSLSCNPRSKGNQMTNPTTDFQKTITDWLNYLETQRGHAPSTP